MSAWKRSGKLNSARPTIPSAVAASWIGPHGPGWIAWTAGVRSGERSSGRLGIHGMMPDDQGVEPAALRNAGTALRSQNTVIDAAVPSAAITRAAMRYVDWPTAC